jgi:hypothetical protein
LWGRYKRFLSSSEFLILKTWNWPINCLLYRQNLHLHGPPKTKSKVSNEPSWDSVNRTSENGTRNSFSLDYIHFYNFNFCLSGLTSNIVQSKPDLVKFFHSHDFIPSWPSVQYSLYDYSILPNEFYDANFRLNINHLCSFSSVSFLFWFLISILIFNLFLLV